MTSLAQACGLALEAVRRARAARSRVAGLARLGLEGAAAAADPGGYPHAATDLEEAFLFMLHGAGQAFVNELRPEVARGAAAIRAELAGIPGDIESTRARARGVNWGMQPGGHFATAWDRYAELDLAARRAVRAAGGRRGLRGPGPRGPGRPGRRGGRRGGGPRGSSPA